MKIYSGIFESSLNGPGFSISLCNLSTAAAESGSSSGEFIDFLNAPTTAPSWPITSLVPSNTVVPPQNFTNGISKPPQISDAEDIKSKFGTPTSLNSADHFSVDAALLDKIIRTACQRAIDAEPNLTKWDMVMGDGDCGEAVDGVSKGTSLLSSHSSRNLH